MFGCNLTSILVRVHAFAQFCLVLFNLFVVQFEYTIDDHECEENGPLTFVTFKVFDFTVVVVSVNGMRMEIEYRFRRVCTMPTDVPSLFIFQT